jgi:hypothetical protein
MDDDASREEERVVQEAKRVGNERVVAVQERIEAGYRAPGPENQARRNRQE